ncbi:MAG TPA: hypothetical protein VFY10_12710 [Dehalococcoidia bacterium]|nr:hypothetical protein [Dehalococcoidia bacterium]
MEWNPWAGTTENYRISIAALVANGTMDAEVAGTLWAAADEQLSFLTAALPRNAGKTTVASAILAVRPPAVPLHYAYGESAELAELRRERQGGYLVIGEFSPWAMPSYIWGDSVRAVFETLNQGYSLQSSLHAPDVDSALRVIIEENRVADAEASHLKLVVHIVVGQGQGGVTQRRVSEVYELDGVSNGVPSGRTLFRWLPQDDRFEKQSEPSQFGLDRDVLRRRREAIDGLVKTGRTSIEDVARMVSGFKARDEA